MQSAKQDISVARRPWDVEDYIDITRRHRAWILGPAFFGLVVAVVVAFLWPDTYVSEAVIRVVPPQVPEKYVPSNVALAMDQRINAMAQSILSKASLTNIIQTYNLYPAKRRSLPMEDVIEDMRTEIKVGNVYSVQRGRSLTAFAVSFAYESKYLAQKVTSDLVGRFIDENIRTRATQSVTTTNFLTDQWQQAKKELDEREQRLAGFRAKFAGRLPDQIDSSLQRLSSLETQIASVSGSINRATQEKMLMESRLQSMRNQLQQLQSSALTPEQSVQARETNQRIQALDRDITNLENSLVVLRERWTDEHPDVQRVKTRIETVQKQRAILVKQEDDREKQREKERATAPPVPRRLDAAVVREIQAVAGQYEQAQGLMRAKDMEIEEMTREQHRLENLAKTQRAALQSEPLNLGEYTILVQDRDLARKRYDELNAMKAQSEIATDLENRKQGETLDLLDPASLPQTPTAPKRWGIIGIGIGFGIMAGISLAAGREMRDTSLKNLKDVRAYTQLTVLASVPLLENDLVVRRRRRLTWLAWSTACLIGIGVMTGSILYYYTTKT